MTYENSKSGELTLADKIAFGRSQQDNLREEIRIILEHARLEADNKGRIVFLAAALTGGAAPFLAIQPDLISLSWLRVASSLFLVTIAIGAIDLIGNRLYRAFIIARSSEQTAAMMAALLPEEMVAPGNVATQLIKASKILGEIQQRQARRKREAVLTDAMFYAAFLLGLIVLSLALGSGG